MELRALGSGSKGNSYLVRSGGTALLVDCGFSCRETVRRLKICGVEPGELAGVLFTHDHGDHCAGAAVFHRKFPGVGMYANGNTADAITEARAVECEWNVFETAEDFGVGGIGVTAFSVSHDAADPVGFLFDDGKAKLFLGTDLGVASAGVRLALAGADCAVVEANYDPLLLESSDRPPSLKQRIRGRSGHLSNGDAADLMRAANPRGLKQVCLAHLSHECNAPHLALEAMGAALKDLGMGGVGLAALAQDEPSARFEF